MIIVRDVFGNIICNAEDFYIDIYSDDFRREVINGIMVTRDLHNGPGAYNNTDPITEDFNLRREAVKVMDWIFERMKAQRGNPNIIIDMKECPYLKEDHR
jgi:hypothetical protein